MSIFQFKRKPEKTEPDAVPTSVVTLAQIVQP